MPSTDTQIPACSYLGTARYVETPLVSASETKSYAGTGKTYTISLSLLRLLQVRSMSGNDTRYVIFLTAMTHAAIDAVATKLRALMSSYRECGRFGMNLDWLNRINLERVFQGSTHPAPSKDETYIFAGTVFQVRLLLLFPSMSLSDKLSSYITSREREV